MKSLQTILLVVILIAGSVKFSKATLYTIEASNFIFTQNFDSILVGDTVKWVWLEGDHTTTSNGIPTGAAPWNVLIDKLHTSYTYVVSFSGTYNYISVPDAPLMGGSFVASWPTGISNPSISISNFTIIGNPSRRNFQYHFTAAHSGTIDVSLYNILGTRIQTLYHGYLPGGDFLQASSLSCGLSSGIYFVMLSVGTPTEKTVNAILTRRVVIQ